MIDPKQFVDVLAGLGVDFYTGVPDSLLKDLCSYLSACCPKENQVIAANEGGAIGLAVGYHLATGRAAMVYMQNSGTGNAINPLLSLADPEVYSIPMFLVIGWRGEPGVNDEPQHKKQGRVQEALLSALGYAYEIMAENPEAARVQLERLVAEMKARSAPVVLLVRKGSFSEFSLHSPDLPDDYPMTREDAIKIILDSIQPESRIISTTGMASREIYEFRESSGGEHSKDFLTVGSMGHAIMIACGLARYYKGPVYCLDGDGAAIMHLGSLGIAADMATPGLRHIVLNNGAHDSVGGQPTIGRSLAFHQVAKGLGYRKSYLAETEAELVEILSSISAVEGPVFLEVRIRVGARKDLGRPGTSPVENKLKFMENL